MNEDKFFCENEMGNLLTSIFRSKNELSEENVEPSLLLEQYASQVLDFSNQYGSDRSFSYTAANCLGVPSKFPNYGDFPQTFVLRFYGKWLNLVSKTYTDTNNF